MPPKDKSAEWRNDLRAAVAGRGKYSFTAYLLASTALLYVLVLGAQFRMISILGDHHRATEGEYVDSPAPGHHHRLALRRREEMMRHRGGGGRGKKMSLESRRRKALGTMDDNGSDARRKDGDRPKPKQDGDHARASSASNPSDLTDEGDARQQSDGSPKDHDDAVVRARAPDPADPSPQYRSMAASIAQKWNLTTPNAVDFLIQQFAKVNDYDPHTDFFHFHHLYKSGGTSISNLMDRTVGLPRRPGMGGGKGGDFWEGILPGSYESGNFHHDEALKDINERMAKGAKREDLPYRASYAHTGLRPVYGPKRTKTGIFFLEHLPKSKRLRVITMLRDPTDFRASNHAMIMCGLNYEVSRWNNERSSRGLPQACSPKDGLNVSAMVDRKIGDLMEKCKKADETEARGEKPTLNNALRNQCKNERKGIDTREHCRSVRHLLASKEYDKHYRSMFKGLMGRFHRGQEFTNGTAYGRMGYGFERAEETPGYSTENVEEYTLQDLGGLDSTISGAGDGVGPPEPDFIWFGITERMKESTTLFYYFFRARPLPKTPDHRVQPCRPNSWWSEEDREEIRRREPADYAVWRAANAILDVRMEKMRTEIQNMLDAGETKESLFYVDWDQLEEIGHILENGRLVRKPRLERR